MLNETFSIIFKHCVGKLTRLCKNGVKSSKKVSDFTHTSSLIRNKKVLKGEKFFFFFIPPFFANYARNTHSGWKSLKKSHIQLLFLIFLFEFCSNSLMSILARKLKVLILSGNTVWLQVSGFQKLAKIDHFWHF